MKDWSYGNNKFFTGFMVAVLLMLLAITCH